MLGVGESAALGNSLQDQIGFQQKLLAVGNAQAAQVAVWRAANVAPEQGREARDREPGPVGHVRHRQIVGEVEPQVRRDPAECIRSVG